MKRLVLLPFFLLLPGLAMAEEAPPVAPAAEEKPFDFMVQNPDFAKQVLGCAELKDDVRKKPKAQLSCEERLNLKYCDWMATLPEPVQKKIELELACVFLAAELTGDNPERDKKILDSLKNVGCEQSNDRSLDLLRSYWKKEKESRALLFFSKEYIDEKIKCIEEDMARQEQADREAAEKAALEALPKLTVEGEPLEPAAPQETPPAETPTDTSTPAP